MKICQTLLWNTFFNPPRYLKLLEIIPTPKTNKDIVSFLMKYGEKFLGKTTVLCHITPAFIANRIGVVGIASLFRISETLDMSVEEIDLLTGRLSVVQNQRHLELLI